MSRSELLLLLAMADNVGETLLCYAEFKTLAGMARMSERTAQRTSERLVEAGKLERTLRPGRTTLFRLLIPADFGKETGERPRRRKEEATHDKMAGVAGSSTPEAAPDTVSGVTRDKMSGVGPTTDCQGPPSNWRGTHDKMSSDSSLDSSLHKPSSHARTRAEPGQSPARAAAPPTERDQLLLKNRAMLAGITPRLPDEPRDRFLRRLEEGEGRVVLDRADQTRRDREASAAAKPTDEAAA